MNYTLVSQNSKAPLPCPDHNTAAWILIFLFSCHMLMDENTEVLWSESAAEGTEEKTKQFLTLLQCNVIWSYRTTCLSCNTNVLCCFEAMLCSGILWQALILPINKLKTWRTGYLCMGGTKQDVFSRICMYSFRVGTLLTKWSTEENNWDACSVRLHHPISLFLATDRNT